MTNNYFKGKITVVFPATKQTALFGKILPIWGNKDAKGDQINFNEHALKVNPRFPEEGGACEIDFKDPHRWTRRTNGALEFYTPNVPFIVYFKIKAINQKDGSVKLVAVGIHSPEKLDEGLRMAADLIIRQPALKDILNPKPKPISMIDAIEGALMASASPTDSFKNKKRRQPQPQIVEDEEEDEGESFDRFISQKYSADANTTLSNPNPPRDSLRVAEDVEQEELEDERKEENADELFEEYDAFQNKALETKPIQTKFRFGSDPADLR